MKMAPIIIQTFKVLYKEKFLYYHEFQRCGMKFVFWSGHWFPWWWWRTGCKYLVPGCYAERITSCSRLP